MKYSIITPQFNSFHLMDNYFDSLMNQTLKDFEVIIVDDCSTDGSWEELQEYVEKSPLQITLLQVAQNAGPGNARNIGMDAARGEWITFVDNDDWVSETFLEEINNIISKDSSLNCVIFDYIIKNEDRESISHSMYYGEEGVKTLSECVISCRNHTFGKFYKLSECVKANVRFPLLRRCEDVAFVCQAIVACGGAYYYKKPLYYYWQRSTSLSNNKKLDHGDLVKAFAILEEKYGKIYPAEMKEKSVSDIFYGGLLMMCKAGKSSNEIKAYLDSYEEKYPEWWKCKLIKHLGKAKEVFLFCARYRIICGLKFLTYLHTRMIK